MVYRTYKSMNQDATAVTCLHTLCSSKAKQAVTSVGNSCSRCDLLYYRSIRTAGRSKANSVEDSTPSDGEVVPLVGTVRTSDNKRFAEVKAFVAGATGGCGRAVVQRLVAEGVPVRALVRDIRRAVQTHFLFYNTGNTWQAAIRSDLISGTKG